MRLLKNRRASGLGAGQHRLDIWTASDSVTDAELAVLARVLARDLAREGQDRLRREGLSGTSLYGAPCLISTSYCTPRGKEGLAGTPAPSYGSEGWGFESLRAR